MRHYDVATVVIKRNNKYLLQRRTGDPNEGTVDLLGTFGGKIEEDESSVDAICRELAEETTLNVLPERMNYIGVVDVTSILHSERVSVSLATFELTLTKDEAIEATEGELVELLPLEVENLLSKMTNGTRAVFEQLVDKE